MIRPCLKTSPQNWVVKCKFVVLVLPSCRDPQTSNVCEMKVHMRKRSAATVFTRRQEPVCLVQQRSHAPWHPWNWRFSKVFSNSRFFFCGLFGFETSLASEWDFIWGQWMVQAPVETEGSPQVPSIWPLWCPQWKLGQSPKSPGSFKSHA